MKVLLLGSGGREHALAYKLRQSKLLKELKVYPGNGGFLKEEIIPTEEMDLKDKKSVQEFVLKEKFDFVVVGPEEPLVNGITDWLEEINVLCFGPSAYCAQLEGSKYFAKQIMEEAKVPTARYKQFSDYTSAMKYIYQEGLPIVVKADGLAAGKGVTVCTSQKEAMTALDEIFIEKKFGNSGSTVVIEEFLEGEEASVFAICDGENFLQFPALQDHKRAYDGDSGPNTGGMGAYCPAPIVKDSTYQKIKDTIFQPMLKTLKKRGYPYKGLLYAGLMINSKGEPKVVEFNCRFGDPETQALMLLLESDLLELMVASAKGQLTKKALEIKSGSSSVVVLAAKGYPEKYRKSIDLNLPKPIDPNTIVFHAGTSIQEGNLVSSGGRVLGIASSASSLKESLNKSYSYIQGLDVEDLFYRKDIGHRAL